MVEGPHLRTGRDDPAKHRIHVIYDVARGNVHDVKAVALKHRVTRRIAPGLVAEIVSLAVDLDDQSMTQAGEIRGEPVGRKLTAKLETVWSLS